MVFSNKLNSSLWQIARRLSSNASDREDLVQEMREHLLRIEKNSELTGRTRSYLMRSCYFWATHYLNRGKSLDSKRRDNVIIMSLDDRIASNDRAKNKGRISAIVDTWSSSETTAIEHTLIGEIRNKLKAKQRETFDLLLNGYRISEIALTRGVDESTVRESIKSIRRIATKYLYPRN